jgi:hypothetical protein
MRVRSRSSSRLLHVRLLVLVAIANAFALVSSAKAVVCVGDCNRNSDVSISDLITMVNVALGSEDPSICVAGDVDGSGEITVDEIVAGVNSALTGCPAPIGRGVCGDQVVDVDNGEECDDGGICSGGTNAGVACNADDDCQGEGVCDAFGFPGGGERQACTSDADCGGARCVHCRPFGGDGCAANCTEETPVVFDVQPGEVDGTDIKIATSGAVVHGAGTTVLQLFPGGTQTFLIGKVRDNRIPLTQKPSLMIFPRAPVGSIACACVRGAVLKTCGGTTKEADGVTDSIDCTLDPHVCDGRKRCAAVAGPGNSTEGTVACDALSGINFSVTQDAAGEDGMAGPAVYSVEPGMGGPGSALIASGNSIGTVIGACDAVSPNYGSDGEFCTADDPPDIRGNAALRIVTTGTGCATVGNANGISGATVGPFCKTGVPLSCGELASGITAGAALAGAFTLLDQPVVRDVAVTSIFVAR